MLRAYTDSKPAGTYILVLSDGQENESPTVASVLPSIKSDGIIVDTIAYR